MKPKRDITGGTILRIPAIQSPNFQANVSGWKIAQDGSAQFNNVTLIGSITIEGSNELLLYSGTPAAGNIIAALSPLAGSDTFGNTWGPGFTLFDGTTGATVVNFGANTGFEFADPNGLGLFLELVSVGLRLVSGAAFSPSLIQAVHGAVFANCETLEISAPTNTGAIDANQSQFIEKFTQANALDGADWRLDFHDSGGTITHLHLTNGTVAVGVKLTVADQTVINSSNVNGALRIVQSVPTTGNPGTISHQESAAGNGAYGVFVNGDGHARFVWDSNGKHRWGPGNAGLDTALERTAAGILAVSTGSMAVTTAGQGYQVKEGSNAKMGTATLVGGTVVVSTTAVTASSRIFLTAQNTGGTPGALRVSARTAGTSFTITSSSAADTSTVAWLIMEPA